MKNIVLIILTLGLFSCKQEVSRITDKEAFQAASLILIDLISHREAMIQKDITTAKAQFSEHITWLNS